MRHSPIKFHKYLPVTTTGFSLLEVIIAMAILAGGIAILGQVIRIGTQSASDSRNLTTAQVLCESTMSELIARVLPLESVQRTPFETNSDWLYSVIIRSTEEEYLFFPGKVFFFREKYLCPRKSICLSEEKYLFRRGKIFLSQEKYFFSLEKSFFYPWKMSKNE